MLKGKPRTGLVVCESEVRRLMTDFVLHHSKVISAGELKEGTGLFSEGVLDSIAFMEMIIFIEDTFAIRLGPVSMQSLDRLDEITQRIIGLSPSR